MSELLKFHTPTVNNGNLEIKVENISGAKLDGKLLIEVQLTLSLVNSQVSDAAELAGVQDDTPNFASLAGVVTTAPGWTVWAFNTPKVAAIRVYNHLDPQTAKVVPVSATIDPGVSLTLRIPLAEKNPRVQVSIPYSYQYGGRDAETIKGTLELITSGAGACNATVRFSTDKTSPTMIPVGEKVKISWEITGGVSAVIRGPMSGGHSELRLSSKSDADYKIAEGSFQITAVGAATYMLDAEVCGPEGQPNVQVVRTLLLDVKSAGKYGNVEVSPKKVLPNGEVDINWAAWGVKKAIISVGSRRKITLTLTEQDLSRQSYGAGIWRLNATVKPEQVQLQIIDATNKTMELQGNINVTKWIKWTKTGYTGNPVGLAVAAPKMALLTTDGIWLTQVGKVDDGTGEEDKTFRKVATSTDTPKAWLAVTAFDKSFVVLQQTAGDGLRLARYKSEGTPPGALLGAPVDLPDTVKSIVSTPGSFFDLAAFGDRAYVVVQTLKGLYRHAFSVRFDPAAEVRPEPWLERLTHYRLLTFNDGLYALNRNTGAMFRFDLTTKKELDEPRKAASATHKGQSLIRKGLLVPVGSVLAVLDPHPFALKSQPLVGLTGAVESDLPRIIEPQEHVVPAETLQDLIYNPQTDEWSACGHGLKITDGAVAAYRGGDSERLWVLQRNGELFTLTGAAEDLFAQDYIEKFPSKPLPIFLNKKRRFTITNETGMDFVPMNEACRKAGLTDVSSTAPVEFTAPPASSWKRGTHQTFELRYNEADPAPITLRFLWQRTPGVKLDYVLEVTFSGADLSTATSVVKRLAMDAQGVMSIAEVPGTHKQHSTAGPIEFFPEPLMNGIKLRVHNATGYELWLRKPEAKDPSERESRFDGTEFIKYSSPAFSIYAHGAGELNFDVDFGMPPGIETSPGSVSQKKLVRINTDKSTGLNVESASFTEPNVYECVLRYIVRKDLEAVYIGDGMPTKDGGSIYLPVALPANAAKVQVWKIDANSLSITAASQTLDGGGVFSAPNSVAVCSEKIAAIFRGVYYSYFDHSLELKKILELFMYRVVTNLKSYNDDTKFFMLGVREESSGPVRYSYSCAVRSFAADIDLKDVNLDAQRGFRAQQDRVAGAPAWVSPSTISPMDTGKGLAVAICVQGGLMVFNMRGGAITEISFEDTGREEAILFDPKDPLIVCAHSKPDNQGLRISRIKTDNPTDKRTITLPSPVTNMATDTRPFTTPALEYKHHRAVSLALPGSDWLFVTHGKTIYYLDKNSLTVRQKLETDLPCRLIQVRPGKLPGESHPRYGAPKDCLWIWAIGATYTGDGTKVDQYQTRLYKIGMPLS